MKIISTDLLAKAMQTAVFPICAIVLVKTDEEGGL